MNKRGQAATEQSYFLFIELVIGIIVTIILMSFATNPDSISNINQIYTEQDSMLLAETILAAPGGVDYTYTTSSVLSIDGKSFQATKSTGFFSKENSYTFRKAEGEKTLFIGEQHG